MTEEERDRRAQEAQLIWDSQIMREAREHIEKTLVKGFAETPLRDDDGLRRVRMLFEAHKAYESFFRAVLDDGKLARIEIERKRTLAERLKGIRI